MSYIVERRMGEFGIRVALGATAADVWRAVTVQSLVPAVIGLVLGMAGARALERFVQASVFGWPSSAAWAAATVTLGLLAIVIAATAAPARRATRVDPAVTFRIE